MSLELSEIATVSGRRQAPADESDAMLADIESAAVVAKAADGDLAAFESLYRRYLPRIYGLCLRLTGQREAAEDCVQETFIAAWKSMANFQSRSLFSTWLQKIAIRTVLTRRRTLRFRLEVSEPVDGLPERADPDSGAPALDAERAIAGLPNRARHVLVLVGIYGYGHREAADVLGIAEGTCKAQLHRARGLLKQALGLETR